MRFLYLCRDRTGVVTNFGMGRGTQTDQIATKTDKLSHGSTVTLTVTPDSGYMQNALAVTGSQGDEIKLTAQSGGKYTFTMSSGAVSVKATFAPLPENVAQPCDCPSHGFADFGIVGAWHHVAVDYVLPVWAE